MNTLTVTALEAGYGNAPVLHDFSVDLPAGTITAVLGANGAGKSTLLKAISGLVPRTAGSVVLDGEDVSALPVEQLMPRGLAHVPEGGGIIRELTVTENLRLGGSWRRGATARRTTELAVAEVLDLFPGLAKRREALGHQLSGGERQMAALGRALVSRPKALLLDEPSLGLAPSVVAQLLAQLAQLRDDTGLTVLLVEQNVGSALAIADSALVVALGRVVARGAASELRGDEAIRHAYLGY
ncbi:MULTISPECIES: ABC transporter ATP-binding protein [Nocardioides]|jgi:branched-chain amino acid transport system ATP-binding protein|uniref:ABC transporter ATP-binding protein n=1 Tax=Nocardioides vastitatis TaxID=2568655 RepID=A0ABW0ZH75_9ACTN|nr:ABC transporter ATP-binding protein [Nocardioides sp.]THJ04309.1 ABC transporter ATP-binding protein [Nocardioides sp.]